MSYPRSQFWPVSFTAHNLECSWTMLEWIRQSANSCRLDALDGLNDHVASSIVRRVAILACVGGGGGEILICGAPNSVVI
jgi:hypothetical protein